jgi:hypothetical protein
MTIRLEIQNGIHQFQTFRLLTPTTTKKSNQYRCIVKLIKHFQITNLTVIDYNKL